MPKKIINLNLSESSINDAIKELVDYRKWIKSKLDILCQELANMGATKVSIGYARSIYSGEKDISVSVVPIENGYSILANGESVLFCEFGAGITYGDGHPMNGELGMGPGTYPSSKGHWNDPNGWWIPKSKGGGHTFGNPPSAVMYTTARELERAIAQVARKVFST